MNLPKFKFTKLFLDFLTKYVYILPKITFYIFVKKFLSSFCFLIELRKMFQKSSCLHASPEALEPLDNSIVDNPLIHSRPHTRHHPSHIMASQQSRFEYGRL